MYDEIIYVCDECDSEYELVIRESNEDAKFCPFCAATVSAVTNESDD